MIKRIRYFWEGVCAYLLYFMFWLLPARTASDFGGYIAKKIGPKLAVSRKALRHITYAFPQINDTEKNKILTDMWENLGRVIAEYPHIKTIALHHTTIIGAEHMTNALSANKPVIVFSAHMANWELAAPTISLQLDAPALLVYRTPNNPMTTKLLARARAVHTKLSFTTKSEKGVRDMVKTLKAKGVIGLLVDQKFNKGLEIPFFDKPAMTSPAFIELAKKFDACLIPLQIVRKQGISFEVILHPTLDVQDKSVEIALTETHTMLENWIKDHPAQWLWLHRRWKENKG